jgi:hypothetical protein
MSVILSPNPVTNYAKPQKTIGAEKQAFFVIKN